MIIYLTKSEFARALRIAMERFGVFGMDEG